MINWIIGILIAVLFIAIVERGIHNMKHPEKKKSSCGCGYGSCAGCQSECPSNIPKDK